ncbi:MAG: hypothetical protein GF403_00710 [Candidatus Coatesbacteria bacterium]|nr:hypothetical protein [Candidatus Coatesbacteria bacterium]
MRRLSTILPLILTMVLGPTLADPGVERPPEMWRLDLDGDGVDEEVYIHAYVEESFGYDETFIELTLEETLIAEVDLGPQGYLTSLVTETLPDGREGLLALHGKSYGVSAGYESWATLWAWEADEQRLTERIALMTGYHSGGLGLASALRWVEDNVFAGWCLDGLAVYEEIIRKEGDEPEQGTPAFHEFRYPGRIELAPDEKGRFHPAGYRDPLGVYLDWPAEGRDGSRWINDLHQLRPFPREALIAADPTLANETPFEILARTTPELESGATLWTDADRLGATTIDTFVTPGIAAAQNENALYLWGYLGPTPPPCTLVLELGTTRQAPELKLSWAGGIGEREMPAAARLEQPGAGRFVIELPWSALGATGPRPVYLRLIPEGGTSPPLLLAPVVPDE